ncbi:hypothetical protein [uncultured Empedobacter sp.]|uniref:hypothetical protein n=1 Tax=uncultured Empedobacter sp. TaxID=410844 RepID=UPI002604BD01|nr:hypothetical protein [uncultured Empedobacter sp.]
MKNFRLLLTLFIFNVFALTIYAQDCDPDDPDCGPPPPDTNAPGNPATPIDEYTIYLIGFAIAVAVVYFAMNKYKKSLI